MADTININVTYNKTKRVISYKKDGDVQGFSRLFLQVFSDVLPCKVTPIQVKFLQHDDKMGAEDYQELQNNDKLDDNKRIRAFVWKEEDISPLKINAIYQLWSPVSQKNDGLLERLPNTDNKNVACSGSFGTGDNTHWTTVDKTQDFGDPASFAFVFEDATTNKKYALKGNGEGNEVTTEEEDMITDKSDVFQPTSIGAGIFSWLKQYDTELYLGCDHEGKVTLVKDEFAEENPSSQIIFSFGKVGVASNN
ncbi:hypothetical protein AWC38_SpisGene13003 [Stylophora pistillata]|uniref:Uncharacterized protein n=1 Tax=Stylophora pistillata TaxID=50429 RepID=A0A2B4RXY5_STYPI|nr:hypothetical protein AWC38_SpisGene13003 [Stylophora pistillata]